jgi:hypothetical protein
MRAIDVFNHYKREGINNNVILMAYVTLVRHFIYSNVLTLDASWIKAI